MSVNPGTFTTNPPATLPNPNSGTAVGWAGSWIATLLLVALLARSSWGKPLVYYSAWLAVAILLLTHADSFAGILQGGGNINPNG